MWRTSATNTTPLPERVVLDATVLRSLGVLSLGAALLTLWDCVIVNTIFDPPDGGELGRITMSISAECERMQHGSSSSSRWGSALEGLTKLQRQLSEESVSATNEDEQVLAHQLSSKDPTWRLWRNEMGIGARRIDDGEAACIAVAVTRGMQFATDDKPAVAAFKSLTSSRAFSTFDALDQLASLGHIEDLEGLERRLIHLRGPQRSR